MNNASVAPTAMTITTRILRGDADTARPGFFLITLEHGNQVVETDDRQIFDALREAKTRNRAVDLDLESSASGRPKITEARVLAGASTTTAAAPTRGGNDTGPTASTALARKAPELPTHLISQPQELTEQMARMSEHYMVLSPAIAVSQMAPGYGANMAIVVIDPTVKFDDQGNGSGPDCYYSKSLLKDPQKRALNKQGLLKIAQAAGIQWDPANCRRLDDGKVQYLWRWQYVGYLRTHDGQLQPVQGSRELDLRDGAAEAVAMTANQLPKARQMGNQICETKAMQRAIRTLGIRQVYTVEELKKPFLIVRFSFTPDMNDPEIKKLVTDRAMSGIGALYATPPASVLPALPSPAAGEGETAADARPQSTPPAPAATAPVQQWPADAKFIAQVKSIPWKNAKGSGTRYEIAATNGEVWNTFNSEHVKDAEFAKEKGWAVRVQVESSERYPDQLDLKAITVLDPRQQPLPMDDASGAGKDNF